MTALPTWTEQLHALDGVVDNLLKIWRPDGPTEAEVQDMNKLALSILACGYLCHVYTDNTRPVFMPLWNYACNQGGPNPDYVYLNAQVDSAGVYEITGFRGTTRFVEITEQETDMLGMGVFTQPRTGPPLSSTRDLDELTIGADGSFRVILSAERPEGHTGDWWSLDPRARSEQHTSELQSHVNTVCLLSHDRPAPTETYTLPTRRSSDLPSRRRTCWGWACSPSRGPAPRCRRHATSTSSRSAPTAPSA